MKSSKFILLLLLAGIPISGLFSQIHDIKVFLEQCPTNDPAIDTILNDFEIWFGEEIVTEFPCIEPISSMPIEEYTQPLIYLQTLRVAYYMDRHMSGHLPWTDTNLYVWMKSNVGGLLINSRITPGGSCCTVIDGKHFISLGNADSANREHDRTWVGISGNLDFLAHEARHRDGDYHHTYCCPSTACDSVYDEGNLGCYAIQWWLNKAWLSGFIDVGVKTSNSKEELDRINLQLLNGMNFSRDRFCVNAPPRYELDFYGRLVVTTLGKPENYGISIYPNPSESAIYIRDGEGINVAEITICDFSGRLIRSYGNIKLAPEDDYPLDISDLSAGPYLIFIKLPDKTMNFKFLKQ